MTRQHVLRAFKQAGFPLRKSMRGRYCYESSVVRVRYVEDTYQNGDGNIMVWFGSRDRGSDFDSPAKALRLIRGRLAMTYVSGNDFALNTGPKGQLRLVEAA